MSRSREFDGSLYTSHRNPLLPIARLLMTYGLLPEAAAHVITPPDKHSYMKMDREDRRHIRDLFGKRCPVAARVFVEWEHEVRRVSAADVERTRIRLQKKPLTETQRRKYETARKERASRKLAA